MKFITFKDQTGTKKAGWIKGQRVYDMQRVSDGELPNTMLEFITRQDTYLPIATTLSANEQLPSYSLDDIELVAPLPNPPSVRDFMAFEEHVANSNKRNGRAVPSEWYNIPVFYFSNHLVISGTNQKIARPPTCSKLDYELEIACIIGKEGKNIQAAEAEDYIFGYTIFNDWSARDLQGQEMQVGLGPAKGKDFATSIGPYLVTKDELEKYRDGDRFSLQMTAKVNGKVLSQGNFKDIYYTFGDMIERASAGVTLYPGDIIGSGTVGTGCILELGSDVHRWLEPGDTVEMEITGLGKLENEIV